jgi:hypothetical protein
MTDTAERRSRRTRLVVILVAWAVAIGAFVAWRIVTDRAVGDESDAIETQLRRVWRDVDLVALEDRFLDAQPDDATTGDDTAFTLVPQPADGEFFSGGFVARNEFVARYTIDTGLAGHGCVAVQVRGPAPNQLTFARHDDC